MKTQAHCAEKSSATKKFFILHSSTSTGAGRLLSTRPSSSTASGARGVLKWKWLSCQLAAHQPSNLSFHMSFWENASFNWHSFIHSSSLPFYQLTFCKNSHFINLFFVNMPFYALTFCQPAILLTYFLPTCNLSTYFLSTHTSSPWHLSTCYFVYHFINWILY